MRRLLAARSEIARELVEPIRVAVGRQDTGHAAFHGCVDWHSAVHGVWALVAYSRMTGDTWCQAQIEDTLRPEKLAAERALLSASPGFEMPYGRAWLLRLAREHALYTAGDRALQPLMQAMACEVLASMLAYYARRAPDPRRGGYLSDSWALLNMLDFAAWSGDAAAEAAIRGLVAAHFIDHRAGCDYALEGGHFMAVATNWAWLVSRVLPLAEFAGWVRAFFDRAGLPQPIAAPANWHHHGLNFSRAWGLWALSATSAPGDAREVYLAAYAAHFRATYETPALWRGSYQGVGHWVPQFGMLALQPLFEEERRS
jgi:drug/metabolite transporter superfamily protein YnfA